MEDKCIESLATAKAGRPVLCCEFEVFGLVQGVGFRDYTQRQANVLGIRGWCANTKFESVKGEIEGIGSHFEEMQQWLRHTGSPTSRIDRCEFGPIRDSADFTHETFSIRHETLIMKPAPT